MYVTHLLLSNFRNYRSLALALPQGLVLIRGDNAQGKTNLLEAVCILAFSRSPRATREGELLAWGAHTEEPVATRIVGEVQRAADRVTVEIALMAAQGRQISSSLSIVGDEEPLWAAAPGVQKRIRVNGLPKRAIDLLGTLRVVLFRPEDLVLISGAPPERRKALDMLLAQMDHRYPRSLQRYSRILLQRNHLLRRIAQEQASIDELMPWDETLAAEGGYLLAQRYLALERLSALADESHAQLSDSQEQLTIRYEPTVQPATGTTADVLTSALLERLAEVRRRDIALGQTTVGPHRDDLIFSINRAPLSAYGSRGQQRTATLAWKLAEARYAREVTGEDPVVLLDDIFSELDGQRRAALLETVQGYQQVVLTTTGVDLQELPINPTASFVIRAGQFHRDAGVKEMD